MANKYLEKIAGFGPVGSSILRKATIGAGIGAVGGAVAAKSGERTDGALKGGALGALAGGALGSGLVAGRAKGIAAGNKNLMAGGSQLLSPVPGNVARRKPNF